MRRNSIKYFSCLSITLFSLHAYAGSTINVRVSTNEQKAAALGYSVDGKKSGGVGRSFSGKGPANKNYLFGYRTKLPHRIDVSCGSHVLTKDSTVTLVTKGNRCKSIVNK